MREQRWLSVVTRHVSERIRFFMAKRNIDYAYKSYVLKEHSDLLVREKKSKAIDFAIYELYENGVVSPILRHLNNGLVTSGDLFNECYEKGLLKELKECRKINHASYKRVKRLKERVGDMLTGGACIFLTLTFSPSTLENTSEKERRVAVTRYLKQYKTRYVANIDYGSKNHREHYHALIMCDKVDFEAWRKYGNINAEKVRNKDIKSDKAKLAKYIAKLSNHAIKETTKRSSLIYSRN